MSLVNRIAVRQPSVYECAKYRPLPGSKRCQHYLEGGSCALPDEFMCIEWLKANGQKVAPPAPRTEAPPPKDPPPAAKPNDRARDLFGAPVSPPAPKAYPKKKPEPARSPSPPTPGEVAPGEPIARIPDEDIASFKALGVEVCLTSEGIGDVWLVPDYTGRERKEISVEHAATLRLVVDAFPGAKVTAFEKLRPAKEPAGKETS
ncbi:MAG: hypothetical protein ACOY3Y_12285 [Acidobacteriota bacterium]